MEETLKDLNEIKVATEDGKILAVIEKDGNVLNSNNIVVALNYGKTHNYVEDEVTGEIREESK